MAGRAVRLSVWLLLVLATLALGFWQLNSGLIFRGDMLALLPADQQQPEVASAIQRNSRSLQQQLVMAVTFPAEVSPELAQLQLHATTLQQMLDESDLFTEPDYRTDQHTIWYTRRYQLLSPATAAVIQDSPQALLQRSGAALFSLAGSANPVDLENDPLQLHQSYLQQFAPSQFEPITRQVFLSGNHSQRYLLASTKIRGSAFDASQADALLQLLASVEQWAASINARSSATGLPVFAARGSAQARTEISTFGTLSLTGVVLLLVSVFASVRPLLATITCITLGIGTALLVTHWWFGHVHLLTLVFGSSLIGISVDYALHYLCDAYSHQPWDPEQGLASVGTGILMAMLTSVLAFLSFTLTPFPGLQQIAVFSATGLLMAFVTVIALLPRVGWQPDPARGFAAGMGRQLSRWAENWPFFGLHVSSGSRTRLQLALLICVLLVVTAGLSRLQPDDRIQILQNAPASLLLADQQVRKLMPLPRASQFYLVEAADQTSLLAAEQQLQSQLRKVMADADSAPASGAVYALSSVYPDPLQQQQNYHLIQQQYFNQPRLPQWLQALGLPATAIRASISTFENSWAPLTLAEWVSGAPPHLQGLWLGCHASGCRSIVSLEQVHDKSRLQQLADNNSQVTWVDQVERISNTLQQYRILATRMLLAVYTVGVLLLTMVFGWRAALRITVVPGGAVALAIATTSLLGNPFTLFSLLALMVVIGISFDYAVFYHLHGRNRAGTGLAVALSAMTSALAFGLLSFSSTTVVHTFGVTLLAGISCAFLLAPFAARPITSTGEKLLEP